MLKLYLNENLSWRIAKALREYGYDVISSHEADMNEEDDRKQFDFAVAQKRAVVTNNFRDFVNLHKDYMTEGKQHYGIIFTAKYPIAVMIRKLRKFVGMMTSIKLMNQIRWLNEIDG